jgi:hypothetical protein
LLVFEQEAAEWRGDGVTGVERVHNVFFLVLNARV